MIADCIALEPFASIFILNYRDEEGNDITDYNLIRQFKEAEEGMIHLSEKKH